MRVWQAQIGLGTRVKREYYGYVEIRDYSPNQFELGNPMLMLYLTRKNNSGALRFMEKLDADVDELISKVLAMSMKYNDNDAVTILANGVISTTFDSIIIAKLKPFLSDAISAFTLGYKLGCHDPMRRGESPVVARGLYKEALSKMQKSFSGQGVVGDACAVLIHKGFYLSRTVK